MHKIKKYILKRLTLTPKARYSELKPKTVEGNLFMYHLKTLMREGYVSPENNRYHLTPKGKQFVDRISFKDFKERIQPKIVTILVIQNNKGEYLLYRRKRSPFIKHVGFPYGKIHLKEHLSEAVTRELKEKTGLETKLKHQGDVYISAYDETELVSHMLCHIFTGKNPTGTLLTDTSIGECFWGKIEDIPKIQLIPGATQIIRLIKKSRGHFFDEYFINVNEEN